MGRKSITEEKRKEIIIAFYNTAKKIGLENTSIAKLAEELEVSKSLILHHFKSKHELLTHLHNFLLEQYLKFLNKNGTPEITSREEIVKYVTSLFSRDWNKYFDDGVFYSCYALIFRLEEFKTSMSSYLEKVHINLKEKLISAKENQVIENDDIDEITEIIFSLVDGAYFYLGTINDNDKYKRLEQLYIKHALGLIQFS
ncbi:TetR family transcriptional regulator [Reichenbachiella versicolor]|uniref:TetR family transcriptional regulator n=1 Tax=Reichenbachiella versicolor TaxID=1821036 RepID=UPI000D6E21DA|nr:TetR family transcriptional regulator [Reichenbachiella versicolor]